MKKIVLVVLAEGFEEIEAVTPIDVLRRAGLEVVTAGVGGREVTGAHGIRFVADTVLEQYTGSPEAVVLPGGLPGADNLKKSEALKALLQKMKSSGKVIGAICASPARVLAAQGLLEGKRATCYPGFESELGSKVRFSTDRVVEDGQVITSRGPGSAMEFALGLVRKLVDEKTAEKLSEGLLAKT